VRKILRHEHKIYERVALGADLCVHSLIDLDYTGNFMNSPCVTVDIDGDGDGDGDGGLHSRLRDWYNSASHILRAQPQ
jgi:hypothetical protein